MPVNRQDFIDICDDKLKLVRVEYGFSQERMAHLIGISKKTLVDIEKRRKSLGWAGAVTLCTVFSGSETVTSTFGGIPTDIIFALAFDGEPLHHPRPSTGRAWWSTIESNEDYLVQQNIISQHYRLLTRKDNRRIVSSFHLDDIMPIFLHAGKDGTGREDA